MSSDEFVSAVKQVTSDTAGDDTIQNLRQPPGRRPAAKLVRLSQWFIRLTSADQQMVREV